MRVRLKDNAYFAILGLPEYAPGTVHEAIENDDYRTLDSFPVLLGSDRLVLKLNEYEIVEDDEAVEKEDGMKIQVGDYVNVTRSLKDSDGDEYTISRAGTVKHEPYSNELMVGGAYVANEHGKLYDDWTIVEHRPFQPPEPGYLGIVMDTQNHIWIRRRQAWYHLYNAESARPYNRITVKRVIFDGIDEEFVKEMYG